MEEEVFMKINRDQMPLKKHSKTDACKDILKWIQMYLN